MSKLAEKIQRDLQDIPGLLNNVVLVAEESSDDSITNLFRVFMSKESAQHFEDGEPPLMGVLFYERSNKYYWVRPNPFNEDGVEPRGGFDHLHQAVDHFGRNFMYEAMVRLSKSMEVWSTYHMGKV
jgi:hypothetical protein